MPRTQLTFRKRDVTAAIEAVEAAGHGVARIEIERDGRVIVVLGDPGNSSTVLNDPRGWDDFLDEN